jgi:hypothetical protein
MKFSSYGIQGDTAARCQKVLASLSSEKAAIGNVMRRAELRVYGVAMNKFLLKAASYDIVEPPSLSNVFTS